MSRLFTRVTASLLLVLLWGAAASADYKADIGFTQLSSELGGSPPKAAGVWVAQVEAESGGANYYMPNVTNGEFNSKTFYYTTYPYFYSDHATTVGTIFYGNSTSIAPGITSIINYDADYWLGSAFLKTGGGQPSISRARVANHSWVGWIGASPNAADNVDALKRLDWVINRDEYIQVVAMNNGSGSSTQPLLSSSFNAIAVGLSNGNSNNGSVALDSLYTASRTRPDLVAPESYTSYATPQVSAAAALLVGVGHNNPGLSTDLAVKSTTNRNNDTIYNAERSEVVKAALMAGASRTAISGYSQNTTNGLNSVYGAGQLNIYNSYHIIAAGEQNSLQDGGTGLIGRYGFDYDPSFGGTSNSNQTASYHFTALASGKMTASLVWNLKVGTDELYDDSATFYHLGLYLYDLSNLGTLVAHADGELDNTENLWCSLNADHNYLLQVSALGDTNFLWDYGLAWDIVPIPGTVYLLGTGFLVLVGFRRKFRS